MKRYVVFHDGKLTAVYDSKTDLQSTLRLIADGTLTNSLLYLGKYDLYELEEIKEGEGVYCKPKYLLTHEFIKIG